MTRRKRVLSALLSAVLLLTSVPIGVSAEPSSENGTVSMAEDGFTIYENQKTASILMDASYDDSTGENAQRNYTQIERAVGDLRQDVAMVTGAIDFEEIQQIFDDTNEAQDQRLAEADQNLVPQFVTDASDITGENVIIIGSIADSNLIKGLIDQGKLEEAKEIQDETESYIIKQVSSPIEGNDSVKNALVIAGSDARGTIYGIYTVSEKIGVSPWYWFSDVPVDVVGADGVLTYAEDTVVEHSPSVAYRGIFINDEEQMREWAYFKEDFAWPDQSAHPGVYRHVFELLLRLKANTLWPAMHEGTPAFNNVVGEDGTELINAKTAAEYGIVMSSSHCEIMLRNNVDEWGDWYEANKTKYNIKGNNSFEAWDYTINKTAILAYWEERIAANKDFENIYTLGMRAVHDGAPLLSNLDGFIANKGQANNLGSTITVNGTSWEAKQAAFIKDVVYEQRQLIKKYYGSEDGALQAFVPYKEMNEYYNYNNRDLANWLAENAPDVTLVWANDNFGYLRQTPTELERQNGRTNGLYYHSSYWGVPQSWLWLNSSHLALMNTEMHRAYNTGADHIWILNVGDIKPGEIAMEHFMDMAWDIEANDDTSITTTLAENAKRDFHVSDEDAAIIADCLDRYYQYNGTKRAEFNGYDYDFSVTGNGDEGMLWVNQWNDLVDRLEGIYDSLDADAKDAFYELILHAVRSSRDAAEEYVYYSKNQLAVSQGRYGSSLMYRELGIDALNRIHDGQDYFWSLNDAKWYGVINYSHLARERIEDGLAWSGDRQPNQGIIMKSPRDYTVASVGSGVGAACENSTTAGSGTLTFNYLNASAGEAHYFDVFGKGASASPWVATAPEWLKLSATSGSVYTEERVIATVDWSKVSTSTSGQIRVYSGTAATGTPVATFTVNANRAVSQLGGNTKGYQEANGYVMIEAEHWSENTAGTDGTKWQTIESLGQRGDSIRITTANDNKVDQVNGDYSAYNEFANGTLSAADKAKVGHVLYNVYFEKAGTYTMTAYRLPTLNEDTRLCRTAVVVNGVSSSNTWIRGNAATNATWSNNILREMEPMSVTITVNAGWNTIELYRMCSSMAFDRFLITTNASVAPPVNKMEIGAPISPNNLVEPEDLQEFQGFRIGELPEDRISVMETELELKSGETFVVDQNLTGYPEGYGIQSVFSKNQTVAAIEDQTITAKRVGTADITVDFIDAEGNLASGVIHLKVSKETDENAGFYQIVDGKLVIDAADALENSEYAKAEKGKDTTGADSPTAHYWALSENGVICLPDTASAQKWIADKWILAPRLSFKILVTEETAGDYVLYINRTTPDGAGDSYYVALNDTLLGQYADDQMVVDRWDSFKERLDLSEPGVYTLDVYTREDGISINQLVLSEAVSTPVGYQEPTARADQSVETPAEPEIPEVLADFTFDDEETGFTSEYAVAEGTHLLQYHNGGKAVYLNGTSDFLNVTAKDGGSLLTGVKEMTVSFQALPTSNDFNWLFYASRNTDTQVYESESYLGIIDKSGTIITERYMNAGGRPVSAQAATGTTAWYYVTIVYTEKESILYINGEERARQASNFPISGIFGTDSILYIGKANWGAGEYYKGLIDNYKIRSRALTAEEVVAEALAYYEKGDFQINITGLRLDSPPAKTEYTVGEELDLTGMKVTAMLSGGTRAEVTNSCKVTGYNPDNTGTQKVTVSYYGRNVSFEVTVNEQEIVQLPFTDVKDGDWFYDVVYYNYVEGYMTGKSEEIFAPEATLTRAELTSILYRINGEPNVTYEAVFTDVPADAWYASPVLWAYQNKVVSGYAEGDFKPDDAITREQLAVIMHNYATAKGYEADASADLNAFNDADQVSGWAKPAVQWAVGNGVISGKNGVSLDPQGNATRAECAAMIQRFMENIAK